MRWAKEIATKFAIQACSRIFVQHTKNVFYTTQTGSESH